MNPSVRLLLRVLQPFVFQPHGRRRVASAGGLAFAAAHRVVDRVHRDAAVVRPPAHPAVAAGLSDRHVLVLEVADLPDRRVALDVDLADLARGQAHLRVGALTGHQLRRRAGRAHELAALAASQLEVVDRGAEGDRLQRQGVARQDVGPGARDDRRAHLEAVRREDVALLAVGVVEQRDPGGPVRVVLDRRDLRRNVLLVPPEVDDPVEPLVAAAHEAGGRPALVVAAARRAQADRQALLRANRREVLESRAWSGTGRPGRSV